MYRLLAVAAVTFALAACGLAAAAPPETASDVELYLTELERIHPNPYHAISKAEYRAAADRLIARLPELDDDQLMVELLRLVALLGERDGHANMNPLSGPPSRAPPLSARDVRVRRRRLRRRRARPPAARRPQARRDRRQADRGRAAARRSARDLRQRVVARLAPQPLPRLGRDPARARDHAHRCARRVLRRGRCRHRDHTGHGRRVHHRAATRVSELPRRDAEARQAAVRAEARHVAVADDDRQGSRPSTSPTTPCRATRWRSRTGSSGSRAGRRRAA